MPITRTGMVDDSGQGTDGTIINNAWKTEFYNQIDALAGVSGTWSPVDASGAGLVFTVADTPRYAKVDRTVFFWLHVFYPATANGTGAIIGGLPFPARLASAGAFHGYGIHRNWLINVGATSMVCYDPASGGPISNATLSGANLVLSGFYVTD